jgi:hypothetical protein
MGEDEIQEQNDASSNPNADEHLPTAGEFRTSHVPEDGTITEVGDDDMDEIPEGPDPDGPANPVATGDKSY